MSKLLILVVIFLMTVTNGYNQKIYQIIRISHNTHQYNFFDEASKNLVFGLYQKDKGLATKTNLSGNSKLTGESFIKFQTEFTKVVPKDFFSGSVVTKVKPIDDTTNKSIWTETTLYSYDLKTKKIVSYVQIKVLFEGTNVEIEKRNPRIQNIIALTSNKIVDRKNIINKQEHYYDKVERDPPPIQN